MHMAGPQVSRDAVGAVFLFVQGDVVGAFEPDDELAFDLVLVVAPWAFWSTSRPSSVEARRNTSMSLIWVLMVVK